MLVTLYRELQLVLSKTIRICDKKNIVQATMKHDPFDAM